MTVRINRPAGVIVFAHDSCIDTNVAPRPATDGQHVEISYRNGFLVDLPSWMRHKDAEGIAANEIKLSLKRRVQREIMDIAAAYCRRFELKPRIMRVADIRIGWGACGPTGSILINWTLVFAPKSVLEYVVAYELAHLKVRSHGADFWALMVTLMPHYKEPKGWLDSHQGALDASFLDLRLTHHNSLNRISTGLVGHTENPAIPSGKKLCITTTN